MAKNEITVGNVEIVAVSDGYIGLPIKEFMPTVPDGDWEPYLDQLRADRVLVTNIGSFVLRSDGKTALVDTGLGPGPNTFAEAESGRLLKEMEASGVRPDEVDMVLITHLHRDHVGTNFVLDGDAYRPAFPNARYWLPRADWELFTRRAGMSAFAYIREQVIPLEERAILEFIEGEQALTSNITALPTPGHTVGHTSFLVSSQGEHAVIVGDALHMPAQVERTEWSPRADSDPKQSAESRRSLVERVESQGARMLSGHFPAPGFGRIVRARGRRYWQAL